jgi:hypothetical protein
LIAMRRSFALVTRQLQLPRDYLRTPHRNDHSSESLDHTE